MDLTELQKNVDNWIQAHGGYWEPFVILARLTEELGEVASALQREKGFRPRKADTNLGGELGDLLFTVAALANRLDIDLDKEMIQVLVKYTDRDSAAWKEAKNAPTSAKKAGQFADRGHAIEIKGIEKVTDREKARFFSEIARQSSGPFEFIITRKDHLLAALPDMPRWVHLAIVFHVREKMVGVELHLEKDRQRNQDALRDIKAQIEDSTLSTGESLTFDFTWRDRQGWTRAYVRTACHAPDINHRKWAISNLEALWDLVGDAMKKAIRDGRH